MCLISKLSVFFKHLTRYFKRLESFFSFSAIASYLYMIGSKNRSDNPQLPFYLKYQAYAKGAYISVFVHFPSFSSDNWFRKYNGLIKALLISQISLPWQDIYGFSACCPLLQIQEFYSSYTLLILQYPRQTARVYRYSYTVYLSYIMQSAAVIEPISTPFCV